MNRIENFLDNNISSVRKPLRYLGGEFNSLSKPLFSSPEQGINVLLAFPDTYEIGMSHLGIRLLYHTLNGLEDVSCDRAYFPYPDMLEKMEEEGIPMFSVENREPISSFDIVGFSVQYELCYTTMLQMMKRGGINIISSQRKDDDPLVVAGGPVVSNPEPIAHFIDAFFIGDAEDTFPRFTEIVREGRRRGLSRQVILEKAARTIPSLYVPGFYEYRYDDDKRLVSVDPILKGLPQRIEKNVISAQDIKDDTSVLVPNIEIVHNRVSLEIMRGCVRGCRFCHAGYFYRPRREKDVAGLIKKGIMMLEKSGYDEISLLSLSSADYSQIYDLMKGIETFSLKRNVSIELPSSRIDDIDERLLEDLAKVKKGGLTIAPEAGSQRLRDVINKNIDEKQIKNAIDTARKYRWNSIKLYFMVGLPTETREDLDGIADIINYAVGSRMKVKASISLFTPKVHTPFQWEEQLSGDKLQETYDYINGKTSRKARLSWRDPFTAYLEGLFSRADRNIAPLLIAASEEDIYLDGWSEYFRKEAWEKILEKHGYVIYHLPSFDTDACLPWDVVDTGVSREFLLEERKKAYEEKTTERCDTACAACGVCGDHIQLESSTEAEKVERETAEDNRRENRKIRIYFSRTGNMKYISQKDMINVVGFSMRRSGVQMVYSQGFSPHPKISFCNPAPLGVTVKKDFFEVVICDENIPSHDFLQGYFPHGFDILHVEEVGQGEKISDYVMEKISLKGAVEDRLDELPVISYKEESGRTTVTYDNRKISMRKIAEQLFGEGFRRYDIYDLQREMIFKEKR